jgi:beta-alanine degradation protein BauB
MTESESNADPLRRALFCALPLLALARRTDAQDAVTVQPQSYRVVLENEHVRVVEYSSRPGMGVCGTGMHSHPAHLSVLLSDARVRETTADGRVTDAGAAPLGTVFWSEAVTHVTENVGGSDVRCLLVELKPAHVR